MLCPKKAKRKPVIVGEPSGTAEACRHDQRLYVIGAKREHTKKAQTRMNYELFGGLHTGMPFYLSMYPLSFQSILGGSAECKTGSQKSLHPNSHRSHAYKHGTF